MNSPLGQDYWLGRSVGDRQRYHLEKHLGSGGMGDVFVAIDTLLGKQVALKLLKDTLVDSQTLRKRFEREVTLCAALKSDHIVNISDYGITNEGYPFYVMEYLPGQSLAQLLRRQQRLDIQRTVSIVAQVCEGLRLAHEGVTLWQNGATQRKQIKVVHRDLKPDNIFLVPTALGELVKVLDFGIAKIRHETAEFTNLTNMFIGTFHYAAPEQFEFKADVDERADIYSLGIILYEMLSGTDPFGLRFNANHNEISGMSWVFAHASKLPIAIRSQPGLSHLSLELEAVVMRCLQKSPQQRFASVGELSQALLAAVTDIFNPNSTTSSIQLNFPYQGGFEEKTVAQTNPHPAEIRNPIVTHIPPTISGTAYSSTERSHSANSQEFTQIGSPEQQSLLLKIFTDFVGPIAPTLFQKVFSTASSTQELLENLSLFLPANQKIEFEKKVKELQTELRSPGRATSIQVQTQLNTSPTSPQPIDPSFMQKCERDLLDLIGPIATFLIQKALKSHPQITAPELVNILASEIPDSKKAVAFCQRLLKQ